jgi:hypothetical protein
MTQEEQIAALQQRIQELATQIASLQALSESTTNESVAARLDAQIASLQQTQQTLETTLNNLQSAPAAFGLARGVTPQSARGLVASHEKAAASDAIQNAKNSNQRAKELMKTMKPPKAG